jgi:hypothetical protein
MKVRMQVLIKKTILYIRNIKSPEFFPWDREMTKKPQSSNKAANQRKELGPQQVSIREVNHDSKL